MHALPSPQGGPLIRLQPSPVCAQARLLPEEHVDLDVHAVDSHRLAYYLDAHHNALIPLVLSALKESTSVTTVSLP